MDLVDAIGMSVGIAVGMAIQSLAIRGSDWSIVLFEQLQFLTHWFQRRLDGREVELRKHEN